ncbi:MAG TPA: EAL domain-containing protein, partial [Thermoanaerobaculia bacterium]|nr:EAL domain-containing protein [Thermoanaerobaculia bacterium]
VSLDISERKRFEAQLSHLANHDALTGLYNRHRFEEELKLQLSQAHRYLVHGALLWCDLDQFKDINDSLGHRAGDELLIKVATSLREQVRDTDILARPGGDEFAVLLPFTSRDEAQQIATRLLDGIRRNPLIVGGKPVRTTASIGIVLYPEHGATTEELLAHADVAMYQAKHEGRNRSMVFSGDREWQAQLSSGMERVGHLREALEHDLFQLYLQPIVDIRTGEVARFELLLRMLGADGRILTPESFLGVAERFGLMRDIDHWVVSRAIRLIAQQWRQGRDLYLEVNLSGTAFTDLEMLPWIQRELAATQIDPSRLVLEITETAAVTDLSQARRFIETLKELGCQFAVDDFGVGFSSFYYLRHLPVDLLKIDGSFIENLPRDPVNQNLVKAMVEMARGLGIQTVAEYVGDAETMAWLRDAGLDYAQGYYLGRPGPAWQVLEACYGPPSSAALRN